MEDDYMLKNNSCAKNEDSAEIFRRALEKSWGAQIPVPNQCKKGI
jgi:hypothetical protein